MNRLLTVALAGTLGAIAPVFDSSAACTCECVNGQMKPLCERALDLPPICPPKICPIVPPSIAPIQPPKIPPIGTKECRQAQVLNPVTNRYEWKEVCR